MLMCCNTRRFLYFFFLVEISIYGFKCIILLLFANLGKIRMLQMKRVGLSGQ